MAAPGNTLDQSVAMQRGWKVLFVAAPVVPLVAGALAFGATQSWLLAASSGSGTPNPGWFLNGREAGLAMITTIALVSALLTAIRQANWLADAAAFTAGAVGAMTIVLFGIGPGTIFPIVIVFGTVVLAAATFVGAGLGWLLRTAWTGRTP
jgi:hypothetical protein